MSMLLQPPPTAEELALKEQVTQMLTSQGVLAKLKAELRAAVFEVMHDREGFTKRSDPTAPKLSDYPIDTATTVVSLIVECLHFFRWENALRVLLAETDAADEQPDTARLATKLRLGNYGSTRTPTLFQLVESRIHESNTAADSATFVSTLKHEQFDEDDNEEEAIRAENELEPKAKSWESEEVVYPLPSKALEKTELKADNESHNESKDELKDGPNDEEGESSAEIEVSMAEEVPSGSELEESNFTNYEDESHDRSATDNTQTTSRYPQRSQEEPNVDEKHEDESNGHESDDSDAVSLAASPPVPAKLPLLPPLVNTQASILAEDAEDDFDAEEEAERLRKLDAALQAMEAEDDTGTLQQLKASLQVELQEQDSFASSGGHGRAADDEDTEAETSKAGGTEEGDDEGYGSSDFEEEEEIASDISEEMESMPELSDKEDESEDGVALSTAKIEPPHALRNDTRVDSEDALNSYDYIEDVEKGGW